jgi:hypothetical protein
LQLDNEKFSHKVIEFKWFIILGIFDFPLYIRSLHFYLIKRDSLSIRNDYKVTTRKNSFRVVENRRKKGQ